MLYRAASFTAFALIASFPAAAAELPAIKTGKDNAVPACVTPGRLMAFAKARNPKLDAQFDGLATEYMRHGEALGIRWDYAFFQMLVETGNLGFTGDVKPKQNNFAGLGATGGGEPGESFKDISTGAKAHLEHVLMYSGEKLESPTAERTRKVQEWGILTSWQKSIKGPMTFAHLTRKWSPKDRRYSDDIASVADSFASGVCKGPDPRPELVQEARGLGGVTKVAAAAPKPGDEAKPNAGADLARQAVAQAKANGDAARSGLGASGLGASGLAAAGKPQPAVTILNAPADAVEAQNSDKPASTIEPLAQAAKPAPDAKTATELGAKGKGKETKVATAAGAGAAAYKPAAPLAAAPAAAEGSGSASCRVWQASYGGAKAVIIKAGSGPETNYTVLDVNEGAEQREAEAYIAAYAKGGQTVGEFGSSTQALDKAFELCPEG